MTSITRSEEKIRDISFELKIQEYLSLQDILLILFLFDILEIVEALKIWHDEIILWWNTAYFQNEQWNSSNYFN